MERQSLLKFEKRVSRLPIRNSDAQRRSRSTGRNTLIAPVVPGSARSRSVSRTPIRARSVETSGRSKKKDCRPVSDKQWQANQTSKIQKYLIEIGRHDLLNNNTTLRPLTLNMFVNVMTALLDPILGNSETLNTANYVERLPVILNLFTYPGVCSASILKSANTTCSWPHILAIMSWAKHLHEWFTTDFEIPGINDKSMEDIVNDLKIKTFKKAYLVINSTTDYYDELRILENWFGEQLDILFNHPNNIEEYIQTTENDCNIRLKACQEIEKKDEAELQEFKKQLKQVHSDMVGGKNHIEYKTQELQKVERGIVGKSEEVKQMNEEISRFENEMELLETEGQIQPSAEEWSQLKEETTNLENQLRRTDEMIQHRQILSKKYDVQYKQQETMFDEKMKAYNMALIELSVTHAELEEVLIPQNVSNEKDIVKILDVKYKKADDLLQKRLKKITAYTEELKIVNAEIQEVENKLEKQQKEMERMKKLSNAKDSEIDTYKEYIIEEKGKYEKQNDVFKQKYLELTKSLPDVQNRNILLQENIKKLQERDEKFFDLEKNMVEFAEKLKENNDYQLQKLHNNMQCTTDKLSKEVHRFENALKDC